MWPQDQLHRAPVDDFPPLWASSWGDDEYGIWADLTITTNGKTATQKMRWIEPSQEGGFLMGSNKLEDHQIESGITFEQLIRQEPKPSIAYVKKGFWLSNTPCTQIFWKTIVGSNPSRFKNQENADNFPVENVMIENKIKEESIIYFLELLNDYLKKIVDDLPFYEPDDDFFWGNDEDRLYGPNIEATLPSEEEWEYACRSDSTEAYSWGEIFYSNRANTNDSGVKTSGDAIGTNDVNLYEPNRWGLYDMHGNVWEWTSSIWKDELIENSSTEDFSWCVLRGGSWLDYSFCARAAYRMKWYKSSSSHSMGFRFLIRPLSQGQ